MTACSDDDTTPSSDTGSTDTAYVGKAVGNFSASEWYPGGVLGTTDNVAAGSYKEETPATAQQGLSTAFSLGETFFKGNFNTGDAPFGGLGPASLRKSCIDCHPGYGHGKRQTSYPSLYGNGYLLAIYHPSTDNPKGGAYVSEVTGMPQTQATTPFLPPIDESQISITWTTVTAMESGLPLHFPDGEAYELIYPTVKIPQSAFNTDPVPENYDVRLESTIGIPGTGLIDAIPDDSLKVQYAREAAIFGLNPKIWSTDGNTWADGAWYTLADGKKKIKKLTYALTRASLQDGPGANAIWNITNVTRSDRHYLYTTDAWAKKMSENNDAINYIIQHGADKSSKLYPYYGDGSHDSVSYFINMLLGLNSPSDSTTYRKYFVNGYGEEMSDDNYYAFMVWHRGLAIPRARNLNDATVQRGKSLFYSIGCTLCHRPSWATTDDDYWTPAILGGKPLPRYRNQKIWPYSDFIQHRLYMKNDIKNEWCRTTPLWGRGLSAINTGAEDRMHDCRARNEVEAIMWHGYSKNSDAYISASKFYNLSKSDRDAVVKFIQSI